LEKGSGPVDLNGKEPYALPMRSTISAKGQVTVPAGIRTELGLMPGTPVEFELRDNGVLLRKGIAGTHPVDRVFGTLQLSKPVDDIVDEMRGPRPKRSRSAGK